MRYLVLVVVAFGCTKPSNNTPPPSDLSTLPVELQNDMTQPDPPDMATLPDMVSRPDMTTAPDLRPAPDMTQLPDLARCGGDHEPCCSGTTCNSGNVCVHGDSDDTCIRCGPIGDLCCNFNPNMTSTATCDSPYAYCLIGSGGRSGSCTACGYPGGPCCPPAPTTYPASFGSCSGLLTCKKIAGSGSGSGAAYECVTP